MAQSAVKPLQGTVLPYTPFDPEQDSHLLRKAMKGIGTDEKAIIDVLAYRSNSQRQQIRQKYKTLFGKDLEADLHGEIGGHFRQTILGLLMRPEEFYVDELKRAMKGVGTDEDALVEILCTQSNSEMAALKTAYKLKHKKDLEDAIISETSGHFRRLLVSLCTGNRIEDSHVDLEKAKKDAAELYAAGEKKFGTDESVFNTVLCARSRQHIRAVDDEYFKLTQHTLEQAINNEMSGDLRRGMVAILHAVFNTQRYFADRLLWSMKGLGTHDDTLIRIIVSRSEIDMVQIMAEFHRHNGKSLASWIEDDTKGDYKRTLLAMIRSSSASKK